MGGNRLSNEIKGMLIVIEYLVEELSQRWLQQLRRDQTADSSQNLQTRSFNQGDKGSGAIVQSQLFLVDQLDVKKLLDWFSRATEQAGHELKTKTQEVISSAEILLQEVDKE